MATKEVDLDAKERDENKDSGEEDSSEEEDDDFKPEGKQPTASKAHCMCAISPASLHRRCKR